MILLCEESSSTDNVRLLCTAACFNLLIQSVIFHKKKLSPTFIRVRGLNIWIDFYATRSLTFPYTFILLIHFGTAY